MSMLQILAPLTGWCTSLDEVPDPVFAGRMLGDGLAIDPTAAVLVAPCAGQIMTLPMSSHSVSLRTANGADILVHIGIDTVVLQGRGFEALVRPGAQVQAGDELIRFDLDVVARGAKSLLTPIVVTSEGALIRNRRAEGAVSAGDALFEIITAEAQGAAAVPTQHSARRTLLMPLRHGLHARPAALFAQRAKGFQSTITVCAHGRSTNARSVVGIMALGVRHDDEVIVEATGADAEQAVTALIAALEEAQGIDSRAQPGPLIAAPMAAPVVAMPGGAGELGGTTAVPGFAVGRATRIERRPIEVCEEGSGIAYEREELERARNDVRKRLSRVAEAGGATRRDIIAAHLEFLDDPSLLKTAQQHLAAGKSAGFAWRSAIRHSIEALQRLGDSRLRERADDLLDVEAHVLLALVGEARPMITPLPEHAVLLADDLLPSELNSLDRQHLAAICLSGGGATSHVAILAASMQIPMLVGVGTGLRDIEDGTTIVVDADRGCVQTTPTQAVVEQAHALVGARLRNSEELRRSAQTECHAFDGTRIEVFANIGHGDDAIAAIDNGAEGCGLLRTEFLFLDRDTAPTEDEQLVAYQAIADALETRPLILRLMDVGGDKPLRYLPLPPEENPALGLRGVRTALWRPDLLRTQLRAALRVQPAGKVRLLIPMVTDAAEIRAVRAVIDELEQELAPSLHMQVGAMIETPAAALTTASLLGELDFLSIGSNDLTQYTLAMDRGHPHFAQRADALHPAVLKLIAAASTAGVAAGKIVAVCGGIAADRIAVPLLLGLGVRELSVVPGAIPAIKRQIRGLRLPDCRTLAMRCLDLNSAAEVRLMVEQWLDSIEEST